MIICADDYALSLPISRAIVDCIESRRITATTCMMTSSDASKSMSLLKTVENKVDIGLHFVLSGEAPVAGLDDRSGLVNEMGRMHTFSKLVPRLLLKIVDKKIIEIELRAQLEKFCDLYGNYPDFFDGHQHIHQLPGVSEIFVKIASEVAKKKAIYVRVSHIACQNSINNLVQNISELTISMFSYSLRKRLERASIPYNRYLFGYHRYHLDGAFKKSLSSLGTSPPSRNDIFFCHPGYLDKIKTRDYYNDPLDPIRVENYKVLMSDEFESLLKKYEISLNRFDLNEA